jgi:hypothetical protein
MYNPIVMSKMFLLNDARILDKFNSTHILWIDGAITNTVHEGYFTQDKVLSNIDKYFDKFSFVCFPYDGKVEIHGFEYKKICEYSNSDVNMVARGGIFGGRVENISEINNIYYTLLYDTLSEGYMGTEESIFTIMTYKYPHLIDYYDIEPNGLLYSFFENIKNSTLIKKNETKNELNIDNVALYVLTYNSPSQFETLCKSFELYDKNFIAKPKKYLLDNSIKKSTTPKYIKLCKKYGFEHIKKDNIGICGGRQFIAEHADENNFDYYLFFEDDMFLYMGDSTICKIGFSRKIDNLFNKAMEIIHKEKYDFMKLSFKEFYGDNTKQYAWHNVPENVRTKVFGKLKDKPYLKFNNIKTHKNLAYADGEIFYCNWPQIVNRYGNKKMFIKTKWDYPYEQTWMSYIYQETIKDEIKPAILLASPIEHDRFEHYTKDERKEN